MKRGIPSMLKHRYAFTRKAEIYIITGVVTGSRLRIEENRASRQRYEASISLWAVCQDRTGRRGLEEACQNSALLLSRPLGSHTGRTARLAGSASRVENLTVTLATGPAARSSAANHMLAKLPSRNCRRTLETGREGRQTYPME